MVSEAGISALLLFANLLKLYVSHIFLFLITGFME